MSYKLLLYAFVASIEVFTPVCLLSAAIESQKLKIVYFSLTGGYTPLWIAVEQGLGKKYGLYLEPVYAGRGVRPYQLLVSGNARYVASSGTGIVSSHAVGIKDLVIIASFANATGTSIFSKREITSLRGLRGRVIGTGRPGGLSDTLLAYLLKRTLRWDAKRDVKVLRLGDDPSIFPALEHGSVDAAVLTTPARFIAKKSGFRELLDVDELGLQYPYVGISTLKTNIIADPETTRKLLRAVTDGIEIFKRDKEESLRVMKRYLRGVGDQSLEETYSYFATKIQRFPYPSVEAIRTALDMMSDQYPQGHNVDPRQVIDLSFVQQIEHEADLR
jgi:NitT/TauT family transport system substrate-binding protein